VTQIGGRMVIAAGGKAVRGAKGRDGKAPHLVAALAHGTGAVLGQVAVDSKPDEVPAVRELLKAFARLAEAVVTMDALHARHDTAQAVLGRGADYVMTVKANMPALYSQLKKLPWKDVPAFSRVTKDHGRRARRTVKAVPGPRVGRLRGRGLGRAGPPHRDQEGKEDRRGRVRRHQRQGRRRCRPGRLDPRGTGTPGTSSAGSATSPARKASPWPEQETHPA
jgi:predicted transposase YbfD/YdcC